MQVTAIYARKSVLTEKGESIQNQIERCKAYADMRGWETKVYFDEDYSGKDLNRPQFQELLKDISRGLIQNVIFYRLDRVSRRVLDIINFIDDLNKKNVGFISISENFDTTTPMGRAMLLITAVFAQLERETIAERIKDNMLDLAKKGKWNGGVPPFGYFSERITYDGKKTSLLRPEPKQSKVVSDIFQWCCEGDTLRDITNKLLARGVHKEFNKSCEHSVLAKMLHNPIYCVADSDAYDYFESLGVTIVGTRDEWDGSKGIMCYNKSNFKVCETYWKDKADWIFSVGLHDGIIPSSMFIKAQKLLSGRKLKGNTPTRRGLLSAGTLKCGCCGMNMNIISGSMILKETGERATYYRCRSKVITELESCSNTNIRSDLMDDVVITRLKELASSPELVKSQIKGIMVDTKEEAQKLKSMIGELNDKIQKHNNKIKSLLDLLLDGTMPKNIVQEKIKDEQGYIETIENELRELEEKQHINEAMAINADIVCDTLMDFVDKFDTASVEAKRALIGKIVESVIWNQGNVEINIWGTRNIRGLLSTQSQRDDKGKASKRLIKFAYDVK